MNLYNSSFIYIIGLVQVIVLDLSNIQPNAWTGRCDSAGKCD